MSQPQTLPQLFLEHCAQFGRDRIAMREKDRGIWKSYAWQDYLDRAAGG